MEGGGSAEDKDRWDSATDSVLRNADACGLDWVRISSHFLLSFNPDECRKRWEFLSPPLIKGAWSTAEDEALRQYSLTTFTHSTHRECQCTIRIILFHSYFCLLFPFLLLLCYFSPILLNAPVPPPLLLRDSLFLSPWQCGYGMYLEEYFATYNLNVYLASSPFCLFLLLYYSSLSFCLRGNVGMVCRRLQWSTGTRACGQSVCVCLSVCVCVCVCGVYVWFMYVCVRAPLHTYIHACRHHVLTLKTVRWSVIALALPGRNGKQCSERWHNHLKPDINKQDWTSQVSLSLSLSLSFSRAHFSLSSPLLPPSPSIPPSLPPSLPHLLPRNSIPPPSSECLSVCRLSVQSVCFSNAEA
jgi:hypothetical protein